MILVDTSIWIELLNGKLGTKVAAEELLSFVTSGPIVQEVLQGLRETAWAERRSARHSSPCPGWATHSRCTPF